MTSSAAILLLSVCCCVYTTLALSSQYDSMFETFKTKYERKYNSLEEELLRRTYFEDNMKTAEQMNAKNPHARFGVTPFSDMSAGEFKSYHRAEHYYARELLRRKPINFTSQSTGSSVDWRDQGAVTQVKNQGQCGSCWSFSTTGNIEGQWAIAGNALTSLSEQELVSCDSTNSACDGGVMDNAFAWIINTQGGSIATAASYPYVSGNQNVPACSMSGTVPGATITGYNDIPHAESSMASYCYSNGPVSVAVDATSWQTYQGGVMTNCISQQLDHGVLIVGFDTNAYPPYWIIKNSWTASWGEAGYIRVEYGTNQCLISSAPSSSYTSSSSDVRKPPLPRNIKPKKVLPSENFTVEVCADAKCGDCKRYQLPQNTCVDSNFVGASFEAECHDFGHTVSVKQFESNRCAKTEKMTTTRVASGSCTVDSKDKNVFVRFTCPKQ